jgi:ribosomal protein S18 acetylase RimI-like enzyme
MSVDLRPLTAADLELAGAMLLAAFVPPLPGEPAEILARSEVRKYIEDWGRPGDRGVVAALAGIDAGAAWYRLFPASAPGYGFVDDATPEISTLAVVEEQRGHGVGRALLAALVEAARNDGFPALSLSVYRGNTEALALYRGAGFVEREDVATSNEHSVTMLRTL